MFLIEFLLGTSTTYSVTCHWSDTRLACIIQRLVWTWHATMLSGRAHITVLTWTGWPPIVCYGL